SRCKRLDLGPDPLSAMHDVAGINGVPEHGQDSARIDWPAAPLATGFGGEFPGRAAALAKLPCQLIGGRGRKPVEHLTTTTARSASATKPPPLESVKPKARVPPT